MSASSAGVPAEPWEEPPDDGHLGWRLSALLDGELGVTEEVVARRHLEACDHCQEEFVEVTAARRLVRGLGDVEPPEGYLDRVLRRVQGGGHPLRLGVVGLVSVAAIWIVILLIGVGVLLPEVAPPVDEFVAQHETAAVDPDRLPEIEPVEVLDPETASSLDAPYVVPETFAGDYEQVVAYDKGAGVVQVLYRDADRQVSLFQQEGSLDWDALPDTGDEVEVDGRRAWVGAVQGAGDEVDQVVVVQHGPVVYTLVGSEDAADSARLVEQLPEPRGYSVPERARKNLSELMRRVGLD